VELQPRLAEFVSAHGASRYLNAKTPTGLASSVDVNADTRFGISGIRNPDEGTLNITIGQVSGADAVTLSACTSCVLGIYKYVDHITDYLVREITVDLDFLVLKPTPHLSVIVRIDDLDDLFITCALATPTGQVSAYCAVEDDASYGKLLIYKERKRTSLDVLPEKPPVDFVLTESIGDFGFVVDFGKLLLADGTGTVTYEGGGNRLLPTPDEGFVKQTKNTPTWEVSGAYAFVEPPAENQILDPYLSTDNGFTVASTHQLITTQRKQASTQFPDYWFRTFAVNASSTINNDWTLEILGKELDNGINIVCGSAFIEFESQRKLRLRVGVREFNATNTVQTRYHEYQVTKVDMNLLSAVLEPMGFNNTCNLFIQVLDICPGDRFTVCVGAPQLENTPTASSRVPSGQRLLDEITVVPNETEQPDTGRIDIVFYPAWSVSKRYQTLWDTRNAQGHDGMWLEHGVDGRFVFGINSDGYTVTCTSSVIPLTYSEQQVTCWFTPTTLRIQHNNVIVGEVVLATPPDLSSLFQLRIGRDYADNACTGEFVRCIVSDDPMNID
jgi:hypothetical protein